MLLAAAVYGIYAFLTRIRPTPFQNISVTKVTDTGDAMRDTISPDGKYILSVMTNERTGQPLAEKCAHQQQYSGAACSRRVLQRPEFLSRRKLFLLCAQRSGKSRAQVSIPCSAAWRHSAKTGVRRRLERNFFARRKETCLHSIRQSRTGEIPAHCPSGGGWRSRREHAGERFQQRGPEFSSLVSGWENDCLRRTACIGCLAKSCDCRYRERTAEVVLGW